MPRRIKGAPAIAIHMEVPSATQGGGPERVAVSSNGQSVAERFTAVLGYSVPSLGLGQFDDRVNQDQRV